MMRALEMESMQKRAINTRKLVELCMTVLFTYTGRLARCRCTLVCVRLGFLLVSASLVSLCNKSRYNRECEAVRSIPAPAENPSIIPTMHHTRPVIDSADLWILHCTWLVTCQNRASPFRCHSGKRGTLQKVFSQ